MVWVKGLLYKRIHFESQKTAPSPHIDNFQFFLLQTLESSQHLVTQPKPGLSKSELC